MRSSPASSKVSTNSLPQMAAKECHRRKTSDSYEEGDLEPHRTVESMRSGLALCFLGYSFVVY